MVIEDDDIDILIIERMIKMVETSINSVTFKDGEAAINFLQEILNRQVIKPEFILLDLMMPIVNGFEFLEMYEKLIYPFMSEVPVIILTTSLHADDKEIAMSYSFVKEFILKPLDRNKILEFV
tara:strand:- start:193 stop:561 length:369 start_codon:yes stop_codon:yes gene_type:complete